MPHRDERSRQVHPGGQPHAQGVDPGQLTDAPLASHQAQQRLGRDQRERQEAGITARILREPDMVHRAGQERGAEQRLLPRDDAARKSVERRDARHPEQHRRQAQGARGVAEQRNRPLCHQRVQRMLVLRVVHHERLQHRAPDVGEQGRDLVDPEPAVEVYEAQRQRDDQQCRERHALDAIPGCRQRRLRGMTYVEPRGEAIDDNHADAEQHQGPLEAPGAQPQMLRGRLRGEPLERPRDDKRRDRRGGENPPGDRRTRGDPRAAHVSRRWK
jgi:hypothetical protein